MNVIPRLLVLVSLCALVLAIGSGCAAPSKEPDRIDRLAEQVQAVQKLATEAAATAAATPGGAQVAGIAGLISALAGGVVYALRESKTNGATVVAQHIAGTVAASLAAKPATG